MPIFLHLHFCKLFLLATGTTNITTVMTLSP